MNAKLKVKKMSREEATDVLLKWMREDSIRLNTRLDLMDEKWNKKFDKLTEENKEEHDDLKDKLAGQTTISGINTAKIVGLAATVSLLIGGVVSIAVAHLSG